MKLSHYGFCVCLLAAAPGTAQTGIPGNPMVNPSSFKNRSIEGSADSGTTVVPGKSASSVVRSVTHIVLHDSRIWTSRDGKPLEAKLIAFEDLVVEAPKGSAEPVMPSPPVLPTVVSGDKARLLVKGKPVEIAISLLSQQDQDLIEGIRAALVKKAAGK